MVYSFSNITFKEIFYNLLEVSAHVHYDVNFENNIPNCIDFDADFRSLNKEISTFPDPCFECLEGYL